MSGGGVVGEFVVDARPLLDPIVGVQAVDLDDCSGRVTNDEVAEGLVLFGPIAAVQYKVRSGAIGIVGESARQDRVGNGGVVVVDLKREAGHEPRRQYPAQAPFSRM